MRYARELHTVPALVGAGLGAAVVPEVAGTLRLPGVESQPIALTPEVFSEPTFAWRERGDNPAPRVPTEGLLPRFLQQHP